MVGAILGNIVSGLLLKGGGLGVKKIFAEPAFRKAIPLTEKSFPNHSIDSALSKWCQSDTFAEILDQIRAGRTKNADERLIDLFIEIGEFDGQRGAYLLNMVAGSCV